MKKYLSYINSMLPKNNWAKCFLFLSPTSLILTLVLDYFFPSIYGLSEFLYQLAMPSVFAILAYPIITTVINARFSFRKELDDRQLFLLKLNDLLTLFIGGIMSWYVLNFIIYTPKLIDWQEQILIYQTHSPFWTPALPSFWGLAGVGLLGYAILAYLPSKNLPPLLLVIGLASSTIGMTFILINLLHFHFTIILGLGLYGANLFLIYSRVMLVAIRNWQANFPEPSPNRPISYRLYQLVTNRLSRQGLVLLTTLPLLVLLVSILSLWGQEPDHLIKLWTETSDWALSQQVSPPSIEADQHYLCTVGAQGHRKLVKPLRQGLRHGKPVIVNRQLLIANAFEDLLAERLPKTHRFIRQVYDRYGYPFAKHIKWAWQADLIYLLMKPAEWLFLTILYLCDSRPENRIALQYITRPPHLNSRTKMEP